MKLTQGTSSIDPAWNTHFNGFAGKLRGGYHFTNVSNIAAEVAQFKAQWQSRTWELDPMLDAEAAGINSAYIKAWIAEWRAQTGHQRIYVYSSKSLFQGACNPAGFADANTPLWAARYYANNANFSTLGWTHPQLEIYQYWNAGSVPGISGSVDMDISNVDLINTQSKGGWLMSLTDAQQNEVYNWTRAIYQQFAGDGGNGQFPEAGVFPGWPSTVPGSDVKLTLVDFVRSLDAGVFKQLNTEDPAILAALAGLATAVAQLSANPNLTVEQITEIVNKAVVSHLNITGTLNIGPSAGPIVPA